MDYITQLKQDTKPNLKDIDLQKIAVGFSERYAVHPFVMVTNYQPLREITFKSELSHLHHLLGFHKLTNKKYSKKAEKVMKSNVEGKITLNDIKKDRNFYIIKDRILMIRLVFLISDKDINLRVCVHKEKNRVMDIRMIEINSQKHIVLGIGKNKESYYYFKTLEIYKAVYERSRKFKIIKTYLLTDDE